MTDTERAIEFYRAIEVERELTVQEERRMVALLKCADDDRRQGRFN